MRLADITERLADAGLSPDAPVPDEHMPCGLLRWTVDAVPGGEYCGGSWHYRASPLGHLGQTGRCPEWVAAEVRARIESEKSRLGGLFSRLEREGGSGWAGFDTSDPNAQSAFDALRRFSFGRPPSRGVVLAGASTGQGKTRLKLAAYMDLLAAGIDARWISMADVERLAVDSKNFDDEVRIPADAAIENIRRAKVVFFDDAGFADDGSKVGEPRKLLKHLLDSRAVWAFSTNLTTEQLNANPVIGPQNLSRLLSCAEIVKVTCPDWRTGRATVL